MKEDEKDNVIDLETYKLSKESEEALKGIRDIFNEAIVHADDPEIQKFLDYMDETLGNLSKEMEKLSEEMDELKTDK